MQRLVWADGPGQSGLNRTNPPPKPASRPRRRLWEVGSPKRKRSSDASNLRQLPHYRRQISTASAAANTGISGRFDQLSIYWRRNNVSVVWPWRLLNAKTPNRTIFVSQKKIMVHGVSSQGNGQVGGVHRRSLSSNSLMIKKVSI